MITVVSYDCVCGASYPGTDHKGMVAHMEKCTARDPAAGVMIQRVARAIFFAQHSIMHDHENEWAKANQPLWRDIAKSAMEAMREPTGAMRDACVGKAFVGDPFRCIWRTMMAVELPNSGSRD